MDAEDEGREKRYVDLERRDWGGFNDEDLALSVGEKLSFKDFDLELV